MYLLVFMWDCTACSDTFVWKVNSSPVGGERVQSPPVLKLSVCGPARPQTPQKNFPSFFPSPHLYLCVYGGGVLNCFFCISRPEWFWNEERELILTRQQANRVSAPWAALFKMILMENISVWVRDKAKGGKWICFCFFPLQKEKKNPHNSGARKEGFSSEVELIKLSWQVVWSSALFKISVCLNASYTITEVVMCESVIY